MKARPGYAGKIARVDLSTGDISTVPTEEYAGDFVGGRGIATRIYWREVPPEVRPLDPENRLMFMTGPCAGFPGLAGSRWQVCGKSPALSPQSFAYSNLGGSWGAGLKAAGFDGLVLQGRAESPVYLVARDGRIEIRDAASLWGKGAAVVRELLRGELGDQLKVVATGPAGDNRAVQASLLAENDASGSGGLGAVMGSKGLKAIAVGGEAKASAAHPERLAQLLDQVSRLLEDTPLLSGREGRENFPLQPDHCAACTDPCIRGSYVAHDGVKGKFICQSSSFYVNLARAYYGQANEVPFYATRLCDNYGLHTKAVSAIIEWLSRCQSAGLLTERSTGLPLGQVGSLEFIETLCRTIALREGFGETLALGLRTAAEEVGHGALDLLADDVTRGGDALSYGPKMYITTGILYAVELRQPIQQLHEVSRVAQAWARWARGVPGAHLSTEVFRGIAQRFWGSELAADFSTYEGKALAAKMVQDRQLAKESSILCDFSWPITYVEHSADHVGDPSLESQMVSAITGRDLSEAEHYRNGERVLNLQRAVLVREGHRGRKSDTLPEACYTVPLETERLNPDCLMPGKDGQTISRKGAVIDRDGFQAMLSEFYALRGWDPDTGLQRQDTLQGLGLEDVAQDLEARGLLAATPP
ncbi:MAG: hypothetical protein HYY01_13345 [Chloroflexi bacterium]|nr:hypothetical protein [Chloroflexota bacterium]